MTTGGSTFWTSGSVPLIEPEFLSSILAAASDLALVVSSDGAILSVVINQSAESFGNLDHWEGRPISEFLTDESIEMFQAAHDLYLSGATPPRFIELNHKDNATWQYPVRYTFHRFGHEGAALLLGRDLRPIAETQQQLVQAQLALERGYEARREFDARYRVLLNNVEEAAVFVTLGTGRIDDANAAAGQLLGLNETSLVGTGLASHFSNRSGAELTESLLNATLADQPEPVLAVTSRTGAAVSLVPHVFRAGGQRVMLCRILSDDKEIPRDEESTRLEGALFAATADAILFMDARGKILSVNESFLDLVGVAHLTEVVGRSLADHLARGQVDLGVLLDNAKSAGQMRVYSTKVLNELGSKVPVEASATYLDHQKHPAIGLIIRDMSRMDPSRGKTSTGGASLPDPGRNVMDLVGSASLKEIVAETTDVVEKMCVETAVELTRNNRVAAAEMLGLSRQSLYVKLRKYGLLAKDG